MGNRPNKMIKLLIKSILMGTANKLPGISGGLVALITGFYTEMIESFKRLDYNLLKFIFKGNFIELNKRYNLNFLLVVLFGIIISYFTTSQLLDYLFLKSELFVWSTFFGMIIGSIVILFKGKKIRKSYDFYFILIGLIFGIVLSNLEPVTENKNLVFVFFCGFISICGMIIPGISGSFLLILLGNYKLLLVDSVNNIFYLLKNLVNDQYNYQIDNDLIYVLAVFCLGSISGLVLLSTLLSHLIRNFNNELNNLIIGFVSGSLFIIWPWTKINSTSSITTNSLSENNFVELIPEINNFENVIAILLIIIGCIFIVYIDYYAKRKKNFRINR
tara:strand:- start:352 stop:1344 length:993 start_codon:yes stop_codon:yes gene_type:complete